MPIRLCADENVSGKIVAAIRRRAPEIDLLTVREAGLDGRPDRDILEFAAQHDRIVISNDRRTMIAEFQQLIAGSEHPGLIILSKQLRIGDALEAIIRLWSDSSQEEFRNQVRYLKIRPGG